MTSDERAALQTRCLGCLREHYAMSVVYISAGGLRCVCGYVSQRLTIPQYRQLLAARREKERDAGRERWS